MNRLALLIAILILAACDTNPPRIDDYRYVAYSWTGGNIDEMIAVWGKPNREHEPATAGAPGKARWRSFSRVGTGGTGESYRYFCEMIARFDEAGSISEIEIVRSQHCRTLYGEGIRDMLRPGVKPPPTWQDT